MAGIRTSDAVKIGLDKARHDMVTLQQQLEIATQKYNDMRNCYNYVLACESNGYKNRITPGQFKGRTWS